MDTAIGVILLVVAVIGLLMLLGGFGGVVYILWQQGKKSAATPGESEGSRQCQGCIMGGDSEEVLSP